MAIAIPVTAGDVTTASSTTSPVTINKPTNVANNDLLLLFVGNKNTSGTHASTGFTSLTTFSTGTNVRTNTVLGKQITSAGTEPSTYSITSGSGTSRYAACAVRATGVDTTTPIDATSTGAATAAATTLAAGSVTAVSASAMLISMWQVNVSGLTAPTLTAPTGQTLISSVVSSDGASTTVFAVYAEQLTAAGATGTRTLGLSASAAINGYMFTLNPATSTASASGTASITLSATGSATGPGGVTATGSLTLTASGSGRAAATGTASLTLTGSQPTPVTQWITNRPMYCAHRDGFYATYGEMTMPGYDAAVAWSSRLALEVSVYQCSTGEWICSHDSTMDRVFGTTSMSIASTSWTTLSAQRSTVGNNPPIRLTDLLNKYGSSRIFLIDNKADSNSTAFLDLLDSYAGPARYIVKSFCTSTTTANAAKLRGYQTWGYYYETDVTGPNLAATQASWTLLGMDIAASQASWNTIKAVGKPVIAHTPASASDKTLADSKSNNGAAGAADGYMAAVVSVVVPPDIFGTASLTLSGSGTARAAGSGSALLTLTATGSTTARATATATLTLSANGVAGLVTPASGTASLTLVATGSAGGSAIASGTASITLTATGAATQSTAQYLFSPPTITVSVKMQGSLRYSYDISLTVWKDDDGWQVQQTPPADVLAAAAVALPGRPVVVSKAIADELVLAGIGSVSPIV